MALFTRSKSNSYGKQFQSSSTYPNAIQLVQTSIILTEEHSEQQSKEQSIQSTECSLTFRDFMNEMRTPTNGDDKDESYSEELDMRYIPIQSAENRVKSNSKSCGSYSIDDALKTLQFGKYQYILICVICIIYFCVSLQFKLSNIILHGNNAHFLLNISFLSGCSFGGCYFCSFADRIGRKKMISICCMLLFIFSILQITFFNLLMLTFIRLCIGCLSVIVIICSNVLLIESVPNSVRFRVMYFLFLLGIASNAFVSFIICLHFIHFRTFLTILSVPILCLPLLNVLYLPQSPHFIALDGTVDDVMDILTNIEYFNQRQSFFNLLRRQTLNVRHQNNENGIFAIFYCLQYRATSIILCVMSVCVWFICSTSTHIQQSFVRYLFDQNENVNFAVDSIVTSCDIISTLLILIFLPFMPRTKLLKNAFFASAFLFFIVFIVLICQSNDDFAHFIGIICIFSAKTAVDVCFYVLQIYILEFYATIVRCTAFGFIFYGIGSIAFIISFVANIFIHSLWIMALIYCILSVIGCVCVRYLNTETMHLPLTDNINEKSTKHQKNITSVFDFDYYELT